MNPGREVDQQRDLEEVRVRARVEFLERELPHLRDEVREFSVLLRPRREHDGQAFGFPNRDRLHRAFRRLDLVDDLDLVRPPIVDSERLLAQDVREDLFREASIGELERCFPEDPLLRG